MNLQYFPSWLEGTEREFSDGEPVLNEATEFIPPLNVKTTDTNYSDFMSMVLKGIGDSETHEIARTSCSISTATEIIEVNLACVNPELETRIQTAKDPRQR